MHTVLSGAWSTESRITELVTNSYQKKRGCHPAEELLHAKLPFFILEEESYLWALCTVHKDVKKFGGASVPPSTYMSTVMSSVITECYQFYQRNQAQGGTIAAYVAELRKLTAHCKLVDTTDFFDRGIPCVTDLFVAFVARAQGS